MLTQMELATRAGLSVGTVAGLESGRNRRPQAGSLRLIADALELDDAQRAALVHAVGAVGESGTEEGGRFTSRPAQLPPAPSGFVGRVTQLRRLDAIAARCRQRTALVTVTGAPGVGKTALVLHWAHQVAADFPDGQLYLDLRGFDSSEPVTPSEAVRAMLEALEFPPARIRGGLDALTAAYRSYFAGRRALVVLDNAYDADQVRPLLPGVGESLVVLTSRNQLASLVVHQGSYPVGVGVFTRHEARQMMIRRLGSRRVDAESESVEELITLCARLPLALSIIAARAALNAGFRIGDLVRELRCTSRRLDALASNEASLDLRSVFSWSYRSLSAGAINLLHLIALSPEPDVTLDEAASLAGVTRSEVRRWIADLTAAHLLVEHKPDRYLLDDLLRCYAARSPAPARRVGAGLRASSCASSGPLPSQPQSVAGRPWPTAGRLPAWPV